MINMVHDQTPVDMWYHDTMNEIVMFKLWADQIRFYLKHPDKYSQTDIEGIIDKFEPQYSKVKAIMLEDYYEKKRMENSNKQTQSEEKK
jgi:hypothetical protein